MGGSWGRTLLLGFVLALALGPVPSLSAEQGHQRMYLLGDGGNFLYWSFDPDDPDASLPSVTRRCGGINPAPPPCYVGAANGERYLQFSFNPRSRPLERVQWNQESPLRFRFEVEVEGLPSSGVQLAVLTGDGLLVSPRAREVAPGVWEGQLQAASEIGPRQLLQLSVRVLFPITSPGTVAPTVTIGTGGRSWVELPAPVTGRSLSDIRRLSPDGSAPSMFRTAQRTFLFNDRDWEVFRFEGDLDAEQDFAVELRQPATGVMGVVEMFGEPALYEAVRHGRLSPERLTDAPTTSLLRNGLALDPGANSRREQAGRGSDTVAATDVAPGTLTLRVTPNDWATDASAAGEDNGYEAYLVVMYGDRTLSGYRARYMPRHSFTTPTARTPFGGACSHDSELLPVSRRAAAVTTSLSWDGVTPLQQWTPTYLVPSAAYYGCGESGNGTTVTTVLTPLARVLPFGATLVVVNPGVSHRDVVISHRVDVLYNPESDG